MLLLEHVHEIDKHIVLAKTREEIVLLELLMVLLDEGADDLRGIDHRRRREVFLRGDAARHFVIDEKDPLQQSVLTHEVLGGSDLELFFSLLREECCGRAQRHHRSKSQKGTAIKPK
jgi:hypothetical protein